MEEKNYRKIVEFLFNNAVNTSSRKLTKPNSNKDIIGNEDEKSRKSDIDIALINLGIDRIKKERFVRIQFVGSQIFYQHYITKDESYKWYMAIDSMDYRETDSPFDDDIPQLFGEEGKKDTKAEDVW